MDFEAIKTKLTVVYCKRCERSDVQPVGDKLWCAWCGKECEAMYKLVEVICKEHFERLHQNASGQLVDLENVQVQPLRISSGWKVMMRNHLFEIDPTPETVKNYTWFNGTMLVMKHDEKNCLLDVGWSDEMNFESGEYRLTLYENDYSGNVLYAYEGKDRLELVQQIEAVLERVTNFAKFKPPKSR